MKPGAAEGERSSTGGAAETTRWSTGMKLLALEEVLHGNIVNFDNPIDRINLGF